MKYSDLLEAHYKYGTKDEDIIKSMGLENILEDVVIAPWWTHDIFDNMNFKIEKLNDKIYNFYRKDISFSFIEMREIGAPVNMEYVLSLGVTKCKNLIFLGSAGSLDKNIKIADIVIPKYSICGDGASRYLNKNLEDEFLKKQYPTKEFTSKLLDILNEEKIYYHFVPNFSIDTVFAQFYHINKILEFNSKVIEMETANIFKCANIMDINVTAIFCISDNSIINKSLFSGRTKEDEEKRRKVRYEIIPNIVIKLFQKQKLTN